VVFDEGRKVMSDYTKYKAPRFADEDAMGIAMTLLDIQPKKDNNFLGSPCCALNKSFKINTNKASCSYSDLLLGDVEPYFVHFPSFVYPFTYGREMVRTYKRHHIKVRGVWTIAVKEMLILNVYWPLSKMVKKLLKIK